MDWSQLRLRQLRAGQKLYRKPSIFSMPQVKAILLPVLDFLICRCKLESIRNSDTSSLPIQQCSDHILRPYHCESQQTCLKIVLRSEVCFSYWQTHSCPAKIYPHQKGVFSLQGLV